MLNPSPFEHILVGPMSPTVHLGNKAFTSPLSSPVCLGDYIEASFIHPFYASYHALESFFMGKQPDSVFPTETLEYNLSGDRSIVDLLQKARSSNNIDALIWWGLQHGLPVDLPALNIPKILVVSDWHFHYAALLPLLEAFDFILCDEKLRSKLSHLKNKIAYWPAYSCVSNAVPVPSKVRDIDILFVGSHNPHKHIQRNAFLLQIANLKANFVHRSDISYREHLHLLSRSKIAFNYALRQEMNLRAYEATSCKSLLFMHEQNLEVKTFLQPGVSYVSYNKSNILERIKYYLKAHVKREHIAEQGFLVMKKHSYTFQFKKLLNLMSVNAVKSHYGQADIDSYVYKRAVSALSLTVDVPVLKQKTVSVLQHELEKKNELSITLLNALFVSQIEQQTNSNFKDSELLRTQSQLIHQLNSESVKQKFPFVLYNLAWACFLQGEHEACGYWLEHYYSSQVRWRPRKNDALFLLPLSYTGLHLLYQEAVFNGSLKNALEGGALFLMGCINRNNALHAFESFSACIVRLPSMAEAYFEAARICLEQSRENQAKLLLTEGLKQGVFFTGAWMRYLSLLNVSQRLECSSKLSVLFQDEKYRGFRELLPSV